MMRWVVESSMKLRLMIVAVAAVLGYFGVTQLRNMPIDVVPEFSRPYVEVQTEALGLSAAEVEAMLTVPLEADLLNGVPFVEEIRSESIPGLSSIVMFFEPGTDLITARQVTQERLLGIHALPNVSTPPRMMQPLSSTSRVMTIGMSSDTHSLIDMSVLARWTVVPRLTGVPGVANVSIWGQRRRQLQVQVDPARLQAEQVTLNQVVEATGNALFASPLTYLEAAYPGPGGWIETPNQRLMIQHVPSISTPEDLAQIAVKGTHLRLGQLANVVEDHQPLIGDALVKDAPSLMLVVEKFPWANTVDVTHAVEETVASLELGLPGVEMDTSLFRPATYLELAAGNLNNALMIGGALALVGLLALFMNPRTALVSAITLVLSVLVAGLVLYLRGEALNMMLLAGLFAALAVMVDDAVVATHAVARRLREGGEKGAGAIVEAILHSKTPLLYATAAALLAVAPVFFMGGVLGVFAQEIVVSYAFAVLASLVVAASAAPVFSYIFMKDGAGDREAPILEALRGAFGGLTSLATNIPGLPVVAAIGGVAVVVVLLGMAGQAELPRFQERDILVEFDAAPGTSGEALGRTLTRATKEMRSIPGVRTVSAHMGRAILSDRVDHIDSGELWVSIDKTADYHATVAAVREAVHGYPGFDIDVNTYLTERMNEDTDGESGLVVRVYGENLDRVRRKAEEVQKLLTRIDGVSDPQVDYPLEHPNLEIQVDIAKAKAAGLRPGDVRRAAATLLGGIEVGNLFEEQKVFDVVVWASPEVRQNISNVENLLIDAPGGSVRLKDLADLRIAASPKVINREAVSEFVDVTADVHGRSHAAVASEVQDRLRTDVEFPLEYRAEVLGSFTELAETRARVRATAIAAAIGVLLLLQVAFGSWRLATFLYLSLPLAALGGVLVASSGGNLMSLGSLFGLAAVLTLAIRNATSLVSHYRDLQRAEGGTVSADLVLRGTADRFVPIMTTAIVTALAVLPFAISGNVAGAEVLNPMAVFILGGLVTTTLVSLLVVPAAFLRHAGDAETLELS